MNIINGCKEAMPATYYLPKNFEGVFAVVYSQKNGTDKVLNGRLEFIVPESRILLTSASFSDGWRNDLFLMKTDNGYDTLKMFLPNMDKSGKLFDKDYYRMYTSDTNKIAVNFRQIVNSVPINNSKPECYFKYELITIGRAEYLNDSLGKIFKENLEKYLEKNICK